MNDTIKKTSDNTILTLTLFIIFIFGASVDIFVPSLPAIHTAFHTSMKLAQLIVPSFLITYGVFQLLFGGVVDSFGRRKTLVLSLGGFAITTLCIPFSTNIYMLLALRAMQGFLAGGMGVCSRTLLSDTFTGAKLAKYATYVTFVWATGTIVSPYIGGHLQHWFGWKASFYLLGFYSLAVFIATAFLLPETAKVTHKFNITTISKNYLFK